MNGIKGGRGEVRIVIEETDVLFESLNCSEDGSSVSLYQMRLTLQDIYNLKERTFFKKKLLFWCHWVKAYGKSKGYLFKPMAAAAKSILSDLDGIISFAESRITNTFMEEAQ